MVFARLRLAARNLQRNGAARAIAGGGFQLRESRRERERAARAGRALRADRSAEQRDQPAADREPETRAAEAPRRRLVGLLERLEQAVDFREIDPDSGIPHAE